jgi:predicted small secreted protein
MTKMLPRMLVALLLLTGAGGLLSACNTTAGVGKDMSAAGHKITNEAEEHN